LPEQHLEPGTLYIVSTPIGNLKDISFRAIDVLSQVDLIAAEDTRKSRILLERYNIVAPLTSFYSYNQVKKTPELLKRLENKDTVAIISDAGTPGISDPAYFLIKNAIEKNINIEAIPGASAFLAALVVSGLPINRFVFEGFLPVKKGRQTRLGNLVEEERTLIFYESPHRILRTLKDFLDNFGNRKIVVARELTKKFEEILRLSVSEALSEFQERTSIKGEFVLVLEGKSKKGRGRL
jgi:16S rRNA (cytidine1402-2'-O)-methyltransferase